MVEVAISAARTTATDLVSTAKILVGVAAIFAVMFGFSTAVQLVLGLVMPM